MLICIPTKGNAGLEETVSDHFGSAPCFTLINSETDEISVIENQNAHHSHGTCHPMNQLSKYKIDCVVCSGMGRRAIEALNFENIKVYQSTSSHVSEIILELKSDKLTEMDPLKSCHGQGQHVHSNESEKVGRGSGYGQGKGQGQGARNCHGNNQGQGRNR